jgi:hypothetical protein
LTTVRTCEITINGVLKIFENYQIGIVSEHLSITKTKQSKKLHINKQKQRQRQNKTKQKATEKNPKQKYKTWFQEAAVRTDFQSDCSI